MQTLKLEKIRMLLFALTTLLMVSACGTERFDTGQSTSLVLPPVVQYEGKLLDQAHAELEVGACPAHVELAKDYKWTRDKLRVAQEQLKNAK